MTSQFELITPYVACRLRGDLRGHDSNGTDLLLIASDLKKELIPDLAQDVNSIPMKLKEDNLPEDCLVHPSCDMTAASIITLASGKKDRFLELLKSTHSHQKRDASNQISLRRKVTVMDTNGLTETFEFSDDHNYWRFVYCIKVAYMKKSRYMRGTCTLTNSEIVKFGPNDSNIVQFSISESKLEVTSSKGDKHTVHLDLVRALALSADFDQYLPIHLQISEFSCRWMDGSGDKISELLMRATYKNIKFGTISSGDMIVSDESFISLLLPNDAMSIIKLYVKYERDNNTLSSADYDNAAVLGKLEMYLHAFFAQCTGSSGSHTIIRKSSTGFVEDNNKRSLEVLPLALQVDIPLSSPDVDLVAKLIIYGARDIPGINSHTTPKVYCVVYIKGRDGSVIEAGGNKTIPVKSNDPQWNVEFLLHTRLGVAEIDSVLIKIKDAGVGSLRHRHIGQVELPAAVFVPTESIAKLHLPLIATDRMIGAGEGMRTSLGEILVGTQIMKVPKVSDGRENGGGHYSSAVGNIRSRVLASPADEEKNVTEIPQGGMSSMKCVLSHTPLSSVWWPGLNLRAMTSEGDPRHSVSFDASSSMQAECLLHPSSLMLRSRTGSVHTASGGVAAAFSSRSLGVFSSRSHTTAESDEIVTIPWTDVVDVTPVTDHTVVISYRQRISSTKKHNSGQVGVAKRSSWTRSGQINSENFGALTLGDDYMQIIDIILGPCPSAVIEIIIRDRITTCMVRYSVRRMFPLKVNSLTVPGALSVCGFAMSSMEECLQIISKDMQGAVKGVDETSVHVPRDHPDRDVYRDCTMFAKSLTLRGSRMRLYILLLMRLCSDLKTTHFPSLNAFELEYAMGKELGWPGPNSSRENQTEFKSFESRVEGWLATVRTWERIPPEDSDDGGYQEDEEDEEGRGPVKTRDIVRVFDEVIASCVRLVNIIILCSWSAIATHASEDNVVKSSICNVITSHHDVIKRILNVFISSNDTFKRLRGQNNRTNFIKYIVVNDAQLAKLLQPSLSLIGAEVNPLPLMLGKDGLKDAVYIYSRGLVAETRMWLSKTIHHSKATRENTCNLPWDIELVGEKIISALPEVLRFQMNPYTELIMDSHVSANSSPDAHRSRLELSNSEEEEAEKRRTAVALWQQIGLHEQILRAICKSLILLAQEYTLILQSRHWELPMQQVMGQSNGSRQGTAKKASMPIQEDSENLMFLVSVANDANRVSNVHLSELLRIESNVDWSQNTNELIQAVTAEFRQVSDRAIKLIVRVIFSDLQAVLSNFETLWQSHGNLGQVTPGTFVPPSPVLAIIATVNDFLGDVSRRIDSTLFFEVVCACADVCAIRYLLFLRSMAQSQKRLNSDDISRIQMDVMEFIQAFKKHCEFEMHHYLNPLSRSLSTLADAVYIVAATSRDDENFIHAMKTLAHQKRHPTKEDKEIIQEALTTLLSLSGASSTIPSSKATPSKSKSTGAVPEEEISRLIAIAMAPVPAGSQLQRNSTTDDSILLRAFRSAEDVPAGGTTGKLVKHRTPAFSTGKKKILMDDTDLKRKMGLMDLARSTSGEITREMLQLEKRGSDEYDDKGHLTSAMTVIIKDIEARGLVSKALIGKSNPYVVVSFDEQRAKTSVKWNTNTPKWSEELKLTNVSTNSASKTIEVRIYDKERLARKTLLGAVTISIDGVDLHPTESWFTLSGGEIGCSGDIHLNIVGKK